MFIAMIVLHITDIEHGILRKIVYIRVLNSHLIIKYKKHFIKMLKDVGIVVPKSKETRL